MANVDFKIVRLFIVKQANIASREGNGKNLFVHSCRSLGSLGTYQKYVPNLGVLACPFNPSILKASRSLSRVPGQPELPMEF